MGRVGWWIESTLAPRIYRSSRYVCVSQATRHELVELGVDDARITVIHNGTDPQPDVAVEQSATPRLCVLGRLVPHKQVEHAIDALASVRLAHPDAVLDVVGDGWWDDELHSHAARVGVTDAVNFHGFVDNVTKHEILAAAWIMLLPSLKEGWGIVVGEAGSHGVPTIAYSTAGGTTESINHKDSGLLVDDEHEFIDATVELVSDSEYREFLGRGAQEKALAHSWEASRTAFAALLSD